MIFGDILRTKRATADPLVLKLPDCLGLFKFLKTNWIFEFWILKFLMDLPSKQLYFLGLFRLSKRKWISRFLEFWIFRWIFGNSYQRSAGVKTTGFSRAFQIFGWVTQPE